MREWWVRASEEEVGAGMTRRSGRRREWWGGNSGFVGGRNGL